MGVPTLSRALEMCKKDIIKIYFYAIFQSSSFSPEQKKAIIEPKDARGNPPLPVNVMEKLLGDIAAAEIERLERESWGTVYLLAINLGAFSSPNVEYAALARRMREKAFQPNEDEDPVAYLQAICDHLIERDLVSQAARADEAAYQNGKKLILAADWELKAINATVNVEKANALFERGEALLRQVEQRHSGAASLLSKIYCLIL